MPVHHETLGYYVSLLTRLLAQAMKVRNGSGGILPGQFPIALALLGDKEMTQKELCERVQIEQGTMAATLKRMERDGLIARIPDTADQRQSIISLTATGLDLTDQAIANARIVNAIAAHGLSEAERNILRHGIDTMVGNLERDLAAWRGNGTCTNKD